MQSEIVKKLGLDSFTHAYLLCALWTFDEDAPSGEYSTSGRPEILFPQFADETIQKAKEDCEKFQRENLADIERAQIWDSRAGHNFWLSRNGHGSGFFDEYSQTTCNAYETAQAAAIVSRDFSARNALKLTCNCPYHACERLQDAARKSGERDLYEGDDQKLYIQ